MFIAASILASGCDEHAESSDPVTSAVVAHVVDGDTVDLLIDGREERVRLLGIDAPESVSRSVPKQCYGAEASDALAALLPSGSTLRIERDAEARDHYGRLLLYLHRAEDDLFVNLWLVESGFAEAVSYAPNLAHETDFERARHQATTADVGLWAHCDGPDQPLD